MKEQNELAKKVNDNLKALGVTHRELTDRLGCGSTVVSMFTNGGDYGASDMTLYVLKALSDRNFLSEFVGLAARRRAKKTYISIQDFITHLGKDRIAKTIGVTVSTINRWVKEEQMRDIWNIIGKPRLGVAALRILAVELTSESVEDGSSDIYDKAKDEATEAMAEVDVAKAKATPERVIEQASVAHSFRKLAASIDQLPLEQKDMTELEEILDYAKSIVKSSFDNQKQKLQEELKRLESLGLDK